MKYGRAVVLVNVSFVNAPGSVLIPTVNSFALVMPVTGKVPLNPEFPTPVVLIPLFTLTISTRDPTERS